MSVAHALLRATSALSRKLANAPRVYRGRTLPRSCEEIHRRRVAKKRAFCRQRRSRRDRLSLVPTLGGGHGAIRERFLRVPGMGSHRRLPHIYPQDRWLFLTWHLYGSLPQAQYPPPHHLSAGRAFVWMDRYLDRAEWGPRFLQHESIATLVVTSLWRVCDHG